MKIKFFLFALLFASTCLAQKKHSINLKPSQIDLPNKQFYIKGIIDNRHNKETIGFVQKGLSNKRVDAIFPTSFVPYLEKTIEVMLPSDKSLIPIIIKVHNFYISEITTAFKEIGTAEISLEFLSADSSRSLGIFQSSIRKNGMDVTKKHDQRILTALEVCFSKLYKHWNTALREGKPITIEHTFNPNAPLTKGIYRSFSDFIRNTPITTNIPRLIPTTTKIKKYKIEDSKKRKQLKDIYGISDGKDFYLNAAQYSYQPHLVKAQFTGTYYYFEDRVSDTGAAIAFGLIGALASNKTIGIVLDTQTGLVSELNRDYLARILKNYPDLRKMYNKSQKKLADKKAVLKRFNEVLAKEE